MKKKKEVTPKKEMSNYDKRGVSSNKNEVHNATKGINKGLYPNAFCNIFPDIAGNEKFASIMHADGAGTKSSLAYAYYKETGDLSVWKGIAQDALVMNLDDVICVGAVHNPMQYTLTIGRNKNRVPKEVIQAIIEGTAECIEMLKQYGINISFVGGETADVGDLVRTIIVDGVLATRMNRKNILLPNIKAGDVIIGLASFGRCIYESEYNSGIGSNGLTSARHDIFGKAVAKKYPESFDSAIPKEVTYCGTHSLTEDIVLDDGFTKMRIAKMVLSPTRTYAPVIKHLLAQEFDKSKIGAIIHCSGGGQTKVSRFMWNGVEDKQQIQIIKDNLFPTPKLFTLIQKSAKTDWKEMYKVFNMGHRMEIYCDESIALNVLASTKAFHVDAKEIGRVVRRLSSDKKVVIIKSEHGVFEYEL